MGIEQKIKTDRTTFAVRIGLANAIALRQAARRHGFPSRNAMLKQLSLWAISAKPEEFEALGLKR